MQLAPIPINITTFTKVLGAKRIVICNQYLNLMAIINHVSVLILNEDMDFQSFNNMNKRHTRTKMQMPNKYSVEGMFWIPILGLLPNFYFQLLNMLKLVIKSNVL